jgi:hypothetical protein
MRRDLRDAFHRRLLSAEGVAMTCRNPLDWPEGWPRTARPAASKFLDHSIGMALSRLHEELRLLGKVGGLVVTSNQPLSRDGTKFLSGKPDDNDAGVAIYFDRNGKPTVMARDAYSTVWENIWSLALAVEAMRQLARHGGEGMAGKAFEGMVALPPPEPWWEVLHVTQSSPIEVVEASYRALAKSAHPDAGGSNAAFARLTAAITIARIAAK